MIRHFFLSLLLCVFGALSLSAQTTRTTFTGTVIDDTDQPIPGATVMVLEVNDSTLISFAGSDTQGRFTFKNVQAGQYLLNVNFLGMQPVFIPITAGDMAEKTLDPIKMVPANKILNEVEVKADYVPIEITKDTISYNADAFETQPNAVVEDLLKKLPGLEVQSDGSIKAQGEDVQKVLVDGKEFFGDDPKMATKNLPAKAVKKVKVYDKQSEMSEFTGVDDGVREKTIDLQLRDEFKKGLFGTAEAGYGTDERYNAKASLNRFTKTSQLSFLGQLNNINDQGFSFSDRMNFNGGMRGMMGGGGGGSRTIEINSSSSNVPINTGNNTGLITTGAAGLNFNYQKSKNFNIRSSYFYNNVDKSLDQTIFRQSLSENSFDTHEDASGTTDNQTHNFTLNSDIQLDSTSQLQFTSRLGLGKGNSLNTSFLQNIANSTTELETTTQTANDLKNLSLNAEATYMKRLGTKGRNFSVSGSVDKSNEDTDSALDALREFLTTGDEELIHQLQDAASDEVEWQGQFSYSEPLKKRRFLELNYTYSHTNSLYDKNVYDITDTSNQINPTLSTDYNSVFQYHRPGMTFRYSGEVHNINAGIQYQWSDLHGQLTNNENGITRSYRHVLPRLIWRYNIGNGKNLRFSYTTRVNAPTITQLSPVVDNSDPSRLYVGNPNLDAEYSHNLNLNFHLFSQFSSSSFFTAISGTFTKNKIINSRTVTDQFLEIYSPVNIDQESRGTLYASFGRPFKPLHSRFTVNANLTYTRSQNLIDLSLLDVNRWSRGLGLTISNLNSKVLEYSVGGRWTFTDNYYPDSELNNQHTLLSNYFVDATLTVWKKWKIEGNFDYNLYSSDEFADNQKLPLLELSISRFILPNDRGQLKLSVFDVLDENRGISRTADLNYLQEVQSNSIGRYAMLSFIYSIRGNSMAPPGGGFRFSERRF